MASANVLGALKVILGADDTDLNKALLGAAGNVERFSAGVKKVLAGLGITAAIGGIGLAIKGAIDEADNLGKLAQKIGIPVDELSRLKLAANLADVELEALGTSVAKLSKNMVEAAAKPTSEAANAFRALGVEVKNSDGTLRTSTQVMGDIAARFETMKDGAGKTAVAMALFGKTGADMIPLLNAGRDGFADASREAEQFGIVIDSKTAKSAEAFNDNLRRLSAVKDGIITQITARMLPAMQAWSDQLVATAKDGSTMQRIADGIASVFSRVAHEVQAVVLFFQRFKAEMAALHSFLSTDIFGGKIAENWRKFRAEGEETERAFVRLRATFADNADPIGVTADALAAAGGKASKAQTDFNYAALAGKNAIDQFLGSQQRRLASLAAETQAFGLNAGAKERLQLVEQTLAVAQANGLTLTDAQRAKMVELGFAVEQYKLRLAGLKLTEEVLPPFEQFNQALQRNKDLFDANVISAETYARANQRTAEQAGATWGQAGESIAGSFAQIGQSFSKENKAMATIAKVAGVIQATISMFVGGAKALELPFPANLAAAAAVVAKGAAMVASIKGTSVAGFSTGGRFRIPGGVGGGDKVHAAFEPGEIVDVWRPNESHRMANDPRGGGAPQTITVPMVGRLFDRETIREWIEQLNAALRDGYRIELQPT